LNKGHIETWDFQQPNPTPFTTELGQFMLQHACVSCFMWVHIYRNILIINVS